MRMAELSRESGVPVATIKFYLREGLLPAGERTGRNQARYGDEHVRRLQFVRALLDIGGLSIAQVRQVIEALDAETPTHDVLGVSQGALTLPTTEASDEDRANALKWVEEVVAGRGWDLEEDDNAVAALVSSLATLRALGLRTQNEWLESYVGAAAMIAEADLDNVASLGNTESIVENAVVGTVVGDTVLASLRRIAQKHVSAQRFGSASG